ncbi:MAG: DNA starvation/stationary phase protection protein Dps [Anaerolineae bacterium]
MSKNIQVGMSHVELDGDARVQMIELLNQQLADAFDLYSQVKQAHWNVKGMNFIAVHELFDTIAANILMGVDSLAERVTALGGVAQGTARMAAANSRLPEFSDEAIQTDAAIKAVVERLGHYATSTRKAIDTSAEAGDMATSDLFTEIVREVDKHIYFLDAHLS